MAYFYADLLSKENSWSKVGACSLWSEYVQANANVTLIMSISYSVWYDVLLV